jgi:hypothetical protein
MRTLLKELYHITFVIIADVEPTLFWYYVIVVC